VSAFFLCPCPLPAINGPRAGVASSPQFQYTGSKRADKKNGPGGGSSSKKTPAGMIKKDAVEEGLDALGNAATPTQLQ
jgi:hypothetical protein